MAERAHASVAMHVTQTTPPAAACPTKLFGRNIACRHACPCQLKPHTPASPHTKPRHHPLQPPHPDHTPCPSFPPPLVLVMDQTPNFHTIVRNPYHAGCTGSPAAGVVRRAAEAAAAGARACGPAGVVTGPRQWPDCAAC
eukprot:365139-Chlamydomonas_euryale.AAC.3